MNDDSVFGTWQVDLCAASDQQCLDELLREWQVRLRCFDRWVKDGRMNLSDAHDRLNRLGAAIALLRANMCVPNSGDKTAVRR